MMNILYISAENGALKGGKVGGIGDVIAELPPALAKLGCQITILTPSHGFLHQMNPENTSLNRIDFFFRGEAQQADLLEIFPENRCANVRHMVIDHPWLAGFESSSEQPKIYTDDPPEMPFATDANRFALFCAASASVIVKKMIGTIDFIHLHDWHAALVAFLRQFSFYYNALKSIPTIFSIHNLGLQGVRPLRGHLSSLEAWFPETNYDWAKIADPRWHDCINPMATGIRLCDKVHTVSPSYAMEIQQPSRKPEFYGGEGLDADLRQANEQGRLEGILNGCVYEGSGKRNRCTFSEMIILFKTEVLRWAGMKKDMDPAHFITYARLLEFGNQAKAPGIVLSFVGRAVEQKTLLFMSAGSDGKSGLEAILDALGDKGCFFLLGSGDPVFETFLSQISSCHENMVFMKGYSDRCARALYSGADLFLMPSSYEPCGISQMLAMREGQPCVVNRVGGLKDTVENGKNGFSFEGKTLKEQVDAMVKTVTGAVHIKLTDAVKWNRICSNAANSRFTWDQAAKQYINKLYGPKKLPSSPSQNTV